MPRLTQTQIAEKLRAENVDELLELWRVEQGPAKPGSLDLMTAAIPFASDKNMHVMDLCCGSGDAGRAIASGFPNAHIDFVDRDLFFTSLCSAANERSGVNGETIVRDVADPNWRRGFENDYDVIIAANCLHWFSREQATRLFADVHDLLRPGGSFLFMEPVAVEARFAPGFATWRSKQPSHHKHEDWLKFWARVSAFLGFDYVKELGERDDNKIGDSLTVLGWVEFLTNSGFQSIDVLLRDPEKMVAAAVKR